MSQGDYLIQNQSFPSFRSDLNSTLEAINTSNSGTSRPSSAVAGTIWLDTTNATTPTLKLYDGTDDISLATFDYSANTVNWLDSTVSADLVNDLSPQLGGMLDVNGNAIGNGTEELIKFSETSSAVNEITVTNSATGNAPEISATGSDTNIDFKLTPKGTGKLVLDGLNFPTADGTTGQFLKTDGSGNLSFDDAGGGKILQVKVNPNNTLSQASTNSTTMVDVNDVDVTLTPTSTSSKIVLWSNFHFDSGGVDQGIIARLTYNHSGISQTEVDPSYDEYSMTTIIGGSRLGAWYTLMNYLAPNTTNEITFRMQFSAGGSYSVYLDRKTLRIIAMEYST